MSKQVMCINKKGSHYNPHERIQAIGGTNNGFRWTRSEDDAIRDIQTDPRSYFVNVNSKAVWVIVAEHKGRKYLKTEPDGYEPNNLLNLPECPK